MSRPRVLKLPRGRPPADPEARADYERIKAEIAAQREAKSVVAGIPVVRRGPPPKDPVRKAEWLATQEAAKAVRMAGGHMHDVNGVKYFAKTPTVLPETEESDNDILARHKESFELLHDVAWSAAKGIMRSLLISGGAGIGKSWNIENVLVTARSSHKIRFEHVKGKVTPLELFKLLYEFRGPKDVLLLDDSDMVFFREDSLNILKAALDTSEKRIITWRSNTLLLEDVPSKFTYEGSMIFISNLDFVRITRGAPSKLSDHLKAVMSRSIYFDLRMHTPRELSIWVRHVVLTKQVLQNQRNLSAAMEKKAVEWIVENREKMMEVSVRSALHLGTFMREHTQKWERMAKRVLLGPKPTLPAGY
jgi:hypothetical protein